MDPTTNNWNETADEITTALFLKEDEAVLGDKLPTTEAGTRAKWNKEIYKNAKIKAEMKNQKNFWRNGTAPDTSKWLL